MGIIHVLTGPDHLSALATLCGTDIKSSQGPSSEAFLHGIRWGIGHSIGILVVGGVLIAMEESSGEWVSMDPILHMIAEMFVGIFMLGLGAYGLYKADKNNRESVIPPVRRGSLTSIDRRGRGMSTVISLGMDDSDSDLDVTKTSRSSGAKIMDDIFNDLDEGQFEALMNIGSCCDDSFVTIPMKAGSFKLPKQGAAVGPISDGQQQDRQSQSAPSPKILKRASSLLRETADNSIIDESSTTGSVYSWVHRSFKVSCCGMGHVFFRSTPSVLALLAGLVHGVAGPGGVLGVIPAVQLRDAKLAALYLGSFCLTSTAVMGGFAAFYGTLSAWLAGGGTSNRIFMVEIGSALLSVCVGFIWLVLVAMNAEVF